MSDSEKTSSQARLAQIRWDPLEKPREGVPQRLILCFDGTFKDGETKSIWGPSNTYALYNSLKKGYVDVRSEPGKDGITVDNETEQVYQRVLYVPGLVTDAWGAVRVLQAPRRPEFWRNCQYFLGIGLERAVAYCFLLLLEQQRTGDEIVLIGYSRGAYLLRVLANFIGRFGFAHFRHSAPFSGQGQIDKWKVVKEFRRLKNENVGFKWHSLKQADSPTDNHIKILAVFDTVKGRVGGGRVNPEYLNKIFLGFRDGDVGPHVESFIHPMSFDEDRDTFPPLYGRCFDVTHKQEVLFAGTHDDVGGGTSRARKALAFMADVLSEEKGIKFDEAELKGFMVEPKPLSGAPYIAPYLWAKWLSTMHPRAFWAVGQSGLKIPHIHQSLAEPDPQDAENELIPIRTLNQKVFLHQGKENMVKVVPNGLESRLLQYYDSYTGQNSMPKPGARLENFWTKQMTEKALEKYHPLERGFVNENSSGVGKSVGGAPRRLRWG